MLDKLQDHNLVRQHRVMIINHYAGSPEYGMEFRPYYIGRELVKMGIDVTVVASSFSHLRKENPVVKKDLEEQCIDGVRYVWIKTHPYKRNDQNRIFNMVGFTQKLKRYAGILVNCYRPDAVVASSTYPFDIYPARRIASLSKAHLYFEIHDLWPLSPIELYGFSPKNPMIRYLQRAEDFAFHNSKKIISILPRADQHIVERGEDPSKFVYIPNGVSINQAEWEKSMYEDLVKDFKRQEKFIVMYVGGFAKANALEEFVKASQSFGDDVQLILVGDGVYKAELQSLARSIGKKNLSFLDPVPKRQVMETLKLADVLYIGAKRSPLYRYGVGMNKLYDYMLAKKPILYGIEAANNIVAEADCGITVKPQSEQAIVDAVNLFKKMSPKELEHFGENAYNKVTNCYNYAKLAEQFAATLYS